MFAGCIFMQKNREKMQHLLCQMTFFVFFAVKTILFKKS